MNLHRKSRPRHLVDIVRRSLRLGKIAIMVIHTSQGHNRKGISDLTGLAAFFKTVEADSTFGVDAEGNDIRMKPDDDKPWTQGIDNSRSLAIEQVAFITQETDKEEFWIKDYHNGLRKVAEILATWSGKYDLPLVHSTFRGVCGHADISGPGGHWDPGPAYPYKYVIWWARYIKLFRRGKKKRAERYARKVKGVQKRAGVKNPTTWYK